MNKAVAPNEDIFKGFFCYSGKGQPSKIDKRDLSHRDRAIMLPFIPATRPS